MYCDDLSRALFCHQVVVYGTRNRRDGGRQIQSACRVSAGSTYIRHQEDEGSGQLIVKRTKTVIQARGVAIAAVLNPGMVKDEMLFGAVSRLKIGTNANYNEIKSTRKMIET